MYNPPGIGFYYIHCIVICKAGYFTGKGVNALCIYKYLIVVPNGDEI